MRLVLLTLLAAVGLSGCLYGVPQDRYGGGYDPYGYPGTGYPGGYPAGGYPGDYRGYGARQVRCESNDNRLRRCAMDTAGGVQVARQLSDRPCIRGRSWDYDRSGVWVDQGCRADFVAGYGRDDYRGGYGRDDYRGGGAAIRCESSDKRRRTCAVDTRGGVALVRQLSDSPCVEGRTWGWDERGVWVDRGCRGEFRTGAGRGGWNSGGYPPTSPVVSQRTVRCESSESRPRRCDVPARGVQLQRQLSKTRCIEGQTWGWDARGIWVSAGCRADFAVW